MPSDIFMAIQQTGGNWLAGETQDDFFSLKNCVELASFNFNLMADETTGEQGGASSGKCKFGTVTVGKKVDNASALLYKAVSTGAILPSMIIAVRMPGGSQLIYLQYIFRYCQITGVTWTGGGEDRVQESMTFTYKAMGLQYVPQKASGQQGTKQQWSWNTVNQGQPGLTIAGIDSPPEYFPPTPK